jgi:Uma2 family endonuclease
MSSETDLSRNSPMAVPALRAGDRLSREEFERRYEAMPQVKKAELIEGVVYMPSPVSTENHGAPRAALIGWLVYYQSKTSGVQVADNATVRLDWDNEPQPDAFLRILSSHGGQTRDEDGFVAGGPEWVGEIAASSASHDLHDKKEAYRRNNVREYLVWRVEEGALDWFVLRGGRYEPLQADADGWLKSEVFPGMWLDTAALLKRDIGRVLEVLQAGLESEGHAEFVRRLEREAT